VKKLDLNTTIGEWVSRRPHAARVFEALQVDYLDGRDDALQRACWDRQLAPHDILAQLLEAANDECPQC